ncbi:YggS family pyridoxal phosphate-dependent enzyme [Candidatus Woesearchaeota archaeon]|nr:YggS family pyridoxal phosphate-dependent enzyme [Candidatus Woesearchaeota archaeon]
MSLAQKLRTLKAEFPPSVTLVAVSKNQPIECIQEAYAAGQQIFGENRVPELLQKYAALPKDIRWHFIGHLQRNKVKEIIQFVHLIHSVDSFNLLQGIEKRAAEQQKIVNCLLQVKIAREETKFGLSLNDIEPLLQEAAHFQHAHIVGLMGMATNTHDAAIIRQEFRSLAQLFQKLRKEIPALHVLSLGMSHDYKIAVEEGSTMVRIGSKLFGERE